MDLDGERGAVGQMPKTHGCCEAKTSLKSNVVGQYLGCKMWGLAV